MKIINQKIILIYLIPLLLLSCEFHDLNEPGLLVAKTVDQDSSLPYVDLNGSRFHVRTYGVPTNPVILFLHGGPGSDSRYLEPLNMEVDGKKLSDDFYLVFWDQRSTGLSRRHTKESLNLKTAYADLGAVIDHYSPTEPIILYGHSWGGMLAAYYVDKYPTRVSALILGEPGPLSTELRNILPPKGEILEILMAEMLNDWFYAEGFLSPSGHASLDYFVQAGTLEPQPERGVDGTVYGLKWRPGASAMYWIVNEQNYTNFDYTVNLKDYSEKVLFIGTDLTTDIGYDFQVKYQKDLFTNAEVKKMTGVGHASMCFEENVDELIGYIRTYLTELTLLP